MNETIKKMRLDVYLFENGYFDSREKARIAIMEGKIYVNNQKEDKPGTMIKIKDNLIVEFRGEKLKYVSRGGLKLEKALEVFNIDLKDKVCADIGSSTGGFTDCMLKNGARLVFAIDCGTNQLDYRLRTDERVITMENTNARYLKFADLKVDKIDFVATDVSFISLKKIIPVIKDLLLGNYDDYDIEKSAVLLIKPQFEAGKELVEKNGVVRDKNVHKKVVNEVIDFCEDNNIEVISLDFSPIKGPAGNIEYLLYIKIIGDDLMNKYDKDLIEGVVTKAHESFIDNKKEY